MHLERILEQPMDFVSCWRAITLQFFGNRVGRVSILCKAKTNRKGHEIIQSNSSDFLQTSFWCHSPGKSFECIQSFPSTRSWSKCWKARAPLTEAGIWPNQSAIGTLFLMSSKPLQLCIFRDMCLINIELYKINELFDQVTHHHNANTSPEKAAFKHISFEGWEYVSTLPEDFFFFFFFAPWLILFHFL